MDSMGIYIICRYFMIFLVLLLQKLILTEEHEIYKKNKN